MEIRNMWEHEALDFTPWLARNLDLLDNELGLNLELVQMEKAVGPMSLDILAREVGTGEMVAIENQLEWSDTHHLGQLMTYSGGCDVRVAIWVATGFSYEYAEALDWLNRMTREGVKFYGVKVEVVKNPDNSKPEPRLRKVVYPGGWDKEATMPLNQTPPHIQKHRDFFQPLIDELMRMNFADSVVQYYGHTGRLFRSRVNRDVGYVAGFFGGVAWVSLDLRTDKVEITNQIYDELLIHRDDIQAGIDIDDNTEWVWQRFDKNYFSCVNVKRDGTIDDPPEKLAEVRAWMLDLLPKFKECFEPRLADLLDRFSPTP